MFNTLSSTFVSFMCTPHSCVKFEGSSMYYTYSMCSLATNNCSKRQFPPIVRQLWDHPWLCPRVDTCIGCKTNAAVASSRRYMSNSCLHGRNFFQNALSPHACEIITVAVSWLRFINPFNAASCVLCLWFDGTIIQIMHTYIVFSLIGLSRSFHVSVSI